jgi:acetyl-CoA carboxylase biotin carboxyl carrier protein
VAEQSTKPDADNQPENLPVDADSAEWNTRVETLRALVGLARESKLSEIELEQDGVRLSLKAAAKSKVQYTTAVQDMVEAASLVVDTHAEAEVDEEEAGAAVDEGLISVVSPMVGIFYRAASPNDPNFVEIGDRVEIGQTLGLVETMKVFNEITSEIEGTVVEIKVINMALVETGDVLLTVRK